MSKGCRSRAKRDRNGETRDMRFRASHQYARLSDTKARIVLEQIKGKNVGDAKAILEYSPRRGAAIILKVLNSAVANAMHLSSERDLDFDAGELYVTEAIANQGPSMKRIQPRAQGRAYRINKLTSHIFIAVAQR